MLKINLPKEIENWVENNRKDQSRAAFIVRCLREIKIIHETTDDHKTEELNREREQKSSTKK